MKNAAGLLCVSNNSKLGRCLNDRDKSLKTHILNNGLFVQEADYISWFVRYFCVLYCLACRPILTSATHSHNPALPATKLNKRRLKIHQVVFNFYSLNQLFLSSVFFSFLHKK